jgi:hypothetical protein
MQRNKRKQDILRCIFKCISVYRAQNSGMPMAKWQVWQAKITMNCQMDNKMAGKIYWTGFVTFSSLTILLYKFFFWAGQKKFMTGQNLFGLPKKKMTGYNFFLFRALV